MPIAHIINAYNGVSGFARDRLDRAVPPERRQKALADTQDYASESPLKFSFALAQLIFCVVPILLFLSFIGSVALFALGTALVFTLFWAGIALAILTPVLCFSFTVAIGVWLWGLACFAIARKSYELYTGEAPKTVRPEYGSAPYLTNGSSSDKSGTLTLRGGVKEEETLVNGKAY
ncbi:hypothetical protein B0T16DRAFT_388011 [Cercophora newfieldiana]|uniref:Uncharacterized protein n=1 Tax=Cercophora newfieldiana TaxID=92897 RepID=A0AA40CXG1_9PEZI|nr:hypothetical protein B0T16DRAFT_388011 [Cercophora newfieldiana]